MKMYSEKKKSNVGVYVTVAILLGILLGVIFWPSSEKKDTSATQNGQEKQSSHGKTTPDDELAAVNPPARPTPIAERLSPNTAAQPAPAKPAIPVSVPTAAPVPSPAKPAAPLPDGAKVYGPKGMTAGLAKAIGPSPLTTPRITPDAAQQAYLRGLGIYKQNNDLIQARTLLNQALNSGALSEQQAGIARKALEDLANKTILKPSPYVNPKDPYLISYKFLPGDLLNSQRGPNGKVTREGIISRFNLCVPAKLIPYVNGFGLSATGFQAGRDYKLVKGPFHIVVYKSKRVADLYLQDLFLRRVKVAIGLPETPTPEGFFRVVAWNGKTANSVYYPPADTGKACVPIAPGEPGYPLGENGYNIKIEGIPQLGTLIEASQSYALHGTGEPASLGTQASRGCVRFSDRDIEFLFIALMDYADPNDKRANWPHWSTITILP